MHRPLTLGGGLWRATVNNRHHPVLPETALESISYAVEEHAAAPAFWPVRTEQSSFGPLTCVTVSNGQDTWCLMRDGASPPSTASATSPSSGADIGFSVSKRRLRRGLRPLRGPEGAVHAADAVVAAS